MQRQIINTFNLCSCVPQPMFGIFYFPRHKEKLFRHRRNSPHLSMFDDVSMARPIRTNGWVAIFQVHHISNEKRKKERNENHIPSSVCNRIIQLERHLRAKLQDCSRKRTFAFQIYSLRASYCAFKRSSWTECLAWCHGRKIKLLSESLVSNCSFTLSISFCSFARHLK